MHDLKDNLLPFAKMQALGNDFIIIDGDALLKADSTKIVLKRWPEIACNLSRQLCSRHFSIGANGLLLSLNLNEVTQLNLAKQIYGHDMQNCQIAWIFTNDDGSASDMCANALRCLVLWAQTKGLVNGQCRVLTGAGPIEIVFVSADNITVNLGEPRLPAKEIPFVADDPSGNVVDHPLLLGALPLPVTLVNMGNPHCIIFVGEFMEKVDMQLPFKHEDELRYLPPQLVMLADQIQRDPRFPQGVNVSFVLRHDRRNAEAIVFERGCGPTLACGSAAAAILVAGVLTDRLERKATVTLPGGSLLVDWSEKDNRVSLCGPARFSFVGEFDLNKTSTRVRASVSVLRG